jgi:2-methylcitrate dehydratase
MAARVHVITSDGREFIREQADYEGSPTRPMSWERVVDKFGWLAEPFCDEPLRCDIVAAVARLDEIKVAELTGLLGAVRPTARCARSKPRF